MVILLSVESGWFHSGWDSPPPSGRMGAYEIDTKSRISFASPEFPMDSGNRPGPVAAISHGSFGRVFRSGAVHPFSGCSLPASDDRRGHHPHDLPTRNALSQWSGLDQPNTRTW